MTTRSMTPLGRRAESGGWLNSTPSSVIEVQRVLQHVPPLSGRKHRCTTGKERRIRRWSTRTSSSGPEASRRRPRQDPIAEQDRRASVRNDQSLDGCNALQDEDAEACRHRDGAARAGLQSEAGDGDPRRAEAAQGDLRLRPGAPQLCLRKAAAVFTQPLCGADVIAATSVIRFDFWNFSTYGVRSDGGPLYIADPHRARR